MRVLRGALWAAAMLAWPAGGLLFLIGDSLWGRAVVLGACVLSLLAVLILARAGSTQAHAERLRAAKDTERAARAERGEGKWPAQRVARWALWCGMVAGLGLIVSSPADLRHMLVQASEGIALTAGCPAALALWWAVRNWPRSKARHAASGDSQQNAEIGRRVDENGRRLDALERGLAAATEYADMPVADQRHRGHLRALSDTGPLPRI
jgi:hypothetical protein